MTDGLKGSVYCVILFDVAEEIRLEQVRSLIGARRLGTSFKHAAPQYVRFEQPPVVEPLGTIVLDGGDCAECQAKYYDYGVISVTFEFPIEGTWRTLVQKAATLMDGAQLEAHAGAIVRTKLARVSAGVVKAYQTWAREDYYVFQIRSDESATGTASALLASHGPEIAQIVRGESAELSPDECKEVLESSLSYYPNDLAVVGWNAAVVVDTPGGAATTIQILEYANSQLLEFRHYDELLTAELARVYTLLRGGTGTLKRWRLVKSASQLQSVALEITELVERVDNAIKFLSDMFSARLYRLAAAKVGVLDYKYLVNEKLHTADDLYRFMVDQFNQARAFILELLVVIILVVELVYFFWGKL